MRDPAEVPIALFVFNRPDTTRRVLERIAGQRPQRLLVVADGPRAERPGEAAACATVRDTIQAAVNWPCALETHYAETNLGCRRRLASGLDWVFGRAEEAIVLEDDCLPDPSFFPYCAELLARYRDDPRVFMISGDNFARRTPVHSYYFSRYAHIWGWASWRRAWHHYDLEMREWPQLRQTRWLDEVLADAPREIEYWRRIFDEVHGGRTSTWDYQWQFALWRHEGMAAAPAQNLVANLGFGADSTHTNDPDDPHAQVAVAALGLPLHHPPEVVRDTALDTLEHGFLRPRRTFAWRLRRSVRKRIRRLRTLWAKLRSSQRD